MPVIWSVDFETGDFSQFDTENFDDTYKKVDATSAIEGSYGLHYEPNPLEAGGGEIAPPATFSESRARLGFQMNLNDVDFAEYEEVTLFREVRLLTLSDVDVALTIWLHKDATGFYFDVRIGQDMGYADIYVDSGYLPNGNFDIEFRFKQASGAGTEDGECQMYINGILDSAVNETSIQNDDRWGANLSTMQLQIDVGVSGPYTDVSGSMFFDNFIFRDDDVPIFPDTPTQGFQTLGMDSDRGNLYITGHRNGSTLQLYSYDLESLVESLVAGEFGSVTNDDIETLSGGVFPRLRPGSDGIVWLYGLDGNGTQVQKNDLSGVTGWVDLSDISWATMVVQLLIDPLKPDRLLALLTNDDIYASNDGGGNWSKVSDGPFTLRISQHRPINSREVVLVGQGNNEIEYSHNYGETSIDIAVSAESDTINLETQITSEADDGAATTPSNTISSTVSSLGDSGASEHSRWARFESVGIPQGAIILSAVLEVYAPISRSGSFTVDVSTEDADDPSAPSSYGDFTGRSRSSPAANWPVQNFTIGNRYQTSDFANSLQGTVDRPGFDETSAIVVFLDYASGSNNWRTVQNYHSQPVNAPKLIVEYKETITPTIIRKVEVAQT